MTDTSQRLVFAISKDGSLAFYLGQTPEDDPYQTKSEEIGEFKKNFRTYFFSGGHLCEPF